MMQRTSTFISGALAIGIYLFVIALFLFYFNSREENKPLHYVKKNDNRIRVTTSTPKNKEKKKTQQTQKKKTEPTKKKMVEPKIKESVKKQNDTRKKVIKEKVVKKVIPKKKPKKVEKKVPPKKVNKPKDLFASVSSKPKKDNLIKVSSKATKPKENNLIKVSKKASASDLVSSSLKIQKNKDRGIENAYFALIEEKLKGWPAQSEYAGEQAIVSLRVEPNGTFIYKITTASGNPDFNAGLDAYLRQLQRIGFGPHKGNRAYDIDVKFVATE